MVSKIDFRKAQGKNKIADDIQHSLNYKIKYKTKAEK